MLKVSVHSIYTQSSGYGKREIMFLISAFQYDSKAWVYCLSMEYEHYLDSISLRCVYHSLYKILLVFTVFWQYLTCSPYWSRIHNSLASDVIVTWILQMHILPYTRLASWPASNNCNYKVSDNPFFKFFSNWTLFVVQIRILDLFKKDQEIHSVVLTGLKYLLFIS